jgi:hypothetical protein
MSTLTTSLSRNLKICSDYRLRNQVPCSCNITGKIIVLYILICTFYIEEKDRYTTMKNLWNLKKNYFETISVFCSSATVQTRQTLCINPVCLLLYYADNHTIRHELRLNKSKSMDECACIDHPSSTVFTNCTNNDGFCGVVKILKQEAAVVRILAIPDVNYQQRPC